MLLESAVCHCLRSGLSFAILHLLRSRRRQDAVTRRRQLSLVATPSFPIDKIMQPVLFNERSPNIEVLFLRGLLYSYVVDLSNGTTGGLHHPQSARAHCVRSAWPFAVPPSRVGFRWRVQGGGRLPYGSCSAALCYVAILEGGCWNQLYVSTIDVRDLHLSRSCLTEISVSSLWHRSIFNSIIPLFCTVYP